ncbi:MAG TPA: peptidoglycan DD-metalloendopeptidase family protein [Chloroflexia bacterium]|nr:peptidoglycan DD-metalloendopeptidase family protein [Chloroflexia bacterium]
MAKKKAVLAITLASANDKPPVRISLNRWVLALCVLVTVAVVGLASVTVYNLLDGTNGGSRGDNLSFRNSASTREQEQEKLIQLGEQRLQELQQENSARKKDVDDLEQRVNELSSSIKSLQQLAKEIEQRLPGGFTAPNGQPTPSGSGQSNQSGVGGGIPTDMGFDPNQGRSYATQYEKVVNELDNVNRSIKNGILNISTLDIQVQSYREALIAQKNTLDTQSNNLALAGVAGGNAPNSLPVNCIVTSPFGMRWSPFVAGVRQMHYGLDLGCYEGTPVAVTKDGVVTYVGYDSGYGNRVEVTHAGGWLTLYGHNNRVIVKVGQTVKKGDIIALSGNTGASTGPHVHYEVHQNGVPVDPAKLLAVPPVYQ